MSRQAVAQFPLLLLLAVFACREPVEMDKSLSDAEGGWRRVRAVLKEVFGEERRFVVAPSTDLSDERFADPGKAASTRKRWAGIPGVASDCSRNGNQIRTTYKAADAVSYAWFLDRYVPKFAGHRVDADVVLQPLAVIMPIPRSPPSASPSFPF